LIEKVLFQQIQRKMNKEQSLNFVRQIIRSPVFQGLAFKEKRLAFDEILATGEITQQELSFLINEARQEAQRQSETKPEVKTVESFQAPQVFTPTIVNPPIQQPVIPTIKIQPLKRTGKVRDVSKYGSKPKELCALLLSKGLKDLSEDEEELVANYLEDSGISVSLKDKPSDLCRKLLQLTMEQEGYDPQRVPINVYANTLLTKEQQAKEIKAQQEMEARRLKEIEDRRIGTRQMLENQANNLPGCVLEDSKILSKIPYNLQVDKNLGIMTLSDNTLQYSSVISVNNQIYEEIFRAYENPIIELVSIQGYRTYVRVAEGHQDDPNLIYISPLVATSLNIENRGAAVAKLCISLPIIKHIKFTFFGTTEELNLILDQILEKLPDLINAFSYLSLGMLLYMIIKTDQGDIKISVRVEALYDDNDQSVFAGLIPFGENDIPFDIDPDLA